jgi:thiosulfate/3-mercaptopyruvate sulfurtransferase|tara:strand:+ start:38152 stop:38991 length:840 start_codon:yes stop_codon:yes gene_type:complete
MRSDLLVTTEWLADRINAPGMAIVDGSFKMPSVTPTAFEDYQARHIPGAVFFDVDAIADKSTSLPHMLPAAASFSEAIIDMGIDDQTEIVVYDTAGLMSARVWWTFRVFGHGKIRILDGGLKKWIAEGRPVTSTISSVTAASVFNAKLNLERVRNKKQMIEIAADRSRQIIDARSKARFLAEEKEPRAGLRSGHIPGSFNLPFSELTNSDGTVKSDEALRDLFVAAGLDLERPVVTTCGSGVTAAGLFFALEILGKSDVSLYDGSWSEWGQPGDTPVEP